MSGTVLVAGTVSAAVAACAQFLNTRYQFDRRLRRQHQHDERQKLRSLIGAYQGRVLEAVLDWRRRMGQIYEGEYVHLDPPDTSEAGETRRSTTTSRSSSASSS